MGNFDFLKRVNENLYVIADEAEKLFRDEYFEQCITQTRRLAENICRDILGDCASPTDTFDDMIATLKDKPAQNDFEKEFVEDMYFLKKAGNSSVHSLQVKHDGNLALDCIKSAFESALNYAVFRKGLDSKFLQQQFDEELLATGKARKKSAISEKYEEEKARENVSSAKKSKKSNLMNKLSSFKKNGKKSGKKKQKNDVDESCDDCSKPFWREVLETIAAGLIITVVYFLIFNK